METPERLRIQLLYSALFVPILIVCHILHLFVSQVQCSTESIVNTIAAEVAGIEINIMSGAYGFQRSLAQKIAKESNRKDYGIYAEFLKIALKHKYLIDTIEVEGLEWETPDQYQDMIKKNGFTAWLQEFESLPEWKKRIAFLEDSAEVLL